MDMGKSHMNLGSFGNKKAKIPKFDENPPKSLEKSQGLETLIGTNPVSFIRPSTGAGTETVLSFFFMGSVPLTNLIFYPLQYLYLSCKLKF